MKYMEQLSEKQKILLNRLMDIISHNDIILDELASEMEIEPSELDVLVNNVEF